MPGRMMCTLCFETAEPETVLEGSGLTEIVGWLCFAIPGWLYCLWRHALRAKVCGACGGAALIRESRAAAARLDPARVPSVSPRFHSASGAVRWPRALQAPRDRLFHGGIGAALSVSMAFGWGIGLFGLAAAVAVAVAVAGWIGFEIARIGRLRAPACAAWDDSGRRLSIEVI